MGKSRNKKPSQRNPMSRLLQKRIFRQRRREDKKTKLLDRWLKDDAKGRGLFN